MNPNTLFSFTRAHGRAQSLGMGHDEALGFALANEYSAREPFVSIDNILAGMPGSDSMIKLDVNGLTCCGGMPLGMEGSSYEREGREVLAIWLPRTTDSVFRMMKESVFGEKEMAVLQEPSLGWSGGWGGHAILGYDEVLVKGMGGIKERILRRLEKEEAGEGDSAAIDWLKGEIHLCDGISDWIRKHRDRALELAETAGEGPDREHYQAIADICGHIAEGAPRNLREAVQLFWFIHVLDNTDSPGRIDQFLLPFYMRLPGDGEAKAHSALPVLNALWQKFIACRSWNVCLGGQTPDGADAANDLTYIFLDLQAKYLCEAPNLSVRFFRGSSPRLMERCVQVISKGSGLPSLYNDEVLIPALCDLGIPLEHARNYAMNGCSQVDIQGMSHMGLEDGELNLAKCLELALHGGVSPITGRQVGPKTLEPSQITDLDALKDQLRIQIDYCTDILTRQANLFQQAMAETAPHLLRSLFISDCIERGKDMKRGGPLYNHGQFLTEGLANTADSLYATERLVFREKRFTLGELVAILDANWESHEALKAEILTNIPKYGNDIDGVDALAAEVLEHYFKTLNSKKTWRGGTYSGGLSTFNRAPEYGRNLGATADGRSKGETVADSCGPMAGRDITGPTAALKSVSKLPHYLATSGLCLNFKLSPSIFKNGRPDSGYDGTKTVAQLFRTYFRLGGQQLQVNVVDRETLVKAQQNPNEYRNLVVRVGGFCAKFVDLERAIQDDIIKRTAHILP